MFLCCGYSLESHRRGDCNEYLQHMFFMELPRRGDSNEYLHVFMSWVLIRIASPSTYNICFYRELTKIILKLLSNTLLICSSELTALWLNRKLILKASPPPPTPPPTPSRFNAVLLLWFVTVFVCPRLDMKKVVCVCSR